MRSRRGAPGGRGSWSTGQGTSSKRRSRAPGRACEQESLQRRLSAERIDVTLPGRRSAGGAPSIPITLVIEEVCRHLCRARLLGGRGPRDRARLLQFRGAQLPAPTIRPATCRTPSSWRTNLLLRTHTSPVQIRTMLKQTPPVRIIAPGTRLPLRFRRHPLAHVPPDRGPDGGQRGHVRRPEGHADDLHQRSLSARDGGPLPPQFFPFTEPSAEVDIACVICGGKGCRVCKQSGWLEILGGGMVDPEVFRLSTTTRGRLPGLPSAWGSSASPCSSTASTICGCSTKTICAFCGSFKGEFP